MILAARIVLAALLTLAGYQIGNSDRFQQVSDSYMEHTMGVAVLMVGGAITGLIVGGVAGKLLARANAHVQDRLRRRSGGELLAGTMGLVLGLVVATMFSVAIRPLEFVGTYLVLPVSLLLAYVFAELAAYKHSELLRLLGIRERSAPAGRAKLVDSSALIDGRIKEVVETGFVEGELVVPLFVLEELQIVADSQNRLRRQRGRRGLDLVRELDRITTVRTPDVEVPSGTGVDGKLLRYAAQAGLVLLTTDYNLAKVARLQGIEVLNVNELAGAIRPAFLAGEQIDLKIARTGTEPDQGVGYLDDGTMIVVSGAADRVGSDVRARVTQVLQTSSGKMVFAELMTGPRRAEPSS